jgi:integrase
MLLRDVLEKWHRASGNQDSSLKQYYVCLNVAAAHGITTVANILDVARVARFVDARLQKVVPKTVEQNVNALVNILRYLERTKEVPPGSADDLAALKPRVVAPVLYEADTLTEKEWRALLEHAPAINAQITLVVALVFYAGLRINEVQQLAREHLDFDARVIRLPWRTKNGRPRAVPMIRELVAFLQREDHEGRLPALGLLLPSQRRPGPISKQKAYDDLDKLAFRAAITRPIDFRVIRATRESIWADQGVDPRALAIAMGHSEAVSRTFYQKVKKGYDTSFETKPGAEAVVVELPNIDEFEKPAPKPSRAASKDETARIDTPSLNTKKMRAGPQGRTTTVKLKGDDLARMQAAERALVKARKRGPHARP